MIAEKVHGVGGIQSENGYLVLVRKYAQTGQPERLFFRVHHEKLLKLQPSRGMEDDETQYSEPQNAAS